MEDASEKAGVNDPHKRHGIGVVWGDYENDGWPDLFVTKDAGPNLFCHNKHNGRFEKVSSTFDQGRAAASWHFGCVGASRNSVSFRLFS